MKKNLKQIFNIVVYIAFIISIITHLITNKVNILNNNERILKEMSESTQITNLNNTINELQTSHTKYSNYIQNSKQKIANAINMYPNNNATEKNTLEEFSTMIKNLTNVPENTYYYESGTEGDTSTIVRYKKIEGEYYICDSNGIVAEGTSATDVSDVTLIPYSGTAAKNLSAGSAGYTSGQLYLGDGSYNEADDKIITCLASSYTFTEDIDSCIIFCSWRLSSGEISRDLKTTSSTINLTEITRHSNSVYQGYCQLIIYKAENIKAGDSITLSDVHSIVHGIHILY